MASVGENIKLFFKCTIEVDLGSKKKHGSLDPTNSGSPTASAIESTMEQKPGGSDNGQEKTVTATRAEFQTYFFILKNTEW